MLRVSEKLTSARSLGVGGGTGSSVSSSGSPAKAMLSTFPERSFSGSIAISIAGGFNATRAWRFSGLSSNAGGGPVGSSAPCSSLSECSAISWSRRRGVTADCVGASIALVVSDRRLAAEASPVLDRIASGGGANVLLADCNASNDAGLVAMIGGVTDGIMPGPSKRPPPIAAYNKEVNAALIVIGTQRAAIELGKEPSSRVEMLVIVRAENVPDLNVEIGVVLRCCPDREYQVPRI